MKVSLLQVLNDEAEFPVEYSSVMDRPLPEEVRDALENLGLMDSVGRNEEDDIVRSLRRGECFWVNETHCFLVLDLDVKGKEDVA